ncbi:uncharacterized protein METZ01_LOCUS58145 [marine metagenome]|uniref:Uncharacterized protein n=1 Tax=marine metagenome TaxID=408172 RepID=A0A381SPP3_9ZZZZ
MFKHSVLEITGNYFYDVFSETSVILY